MLKNIYRFCRDSLIIVIKWFLFLIPKDQKLVLCSAWFGNKYADNTMYQYEYMLNNTEYKLCWTTKNKEIYNLLQNEGKPVVLSNSIKGIWMQIRAKVLLSTIQLSDFNKFFLCKCIYIDLDHGIIYKQVYYDLAPDNPYLEKHDNIVKKYIDYYSTTPSFLTMHMMKHSFHLPEEKLILCGKPRLDYFFDSKIRKQNNQIEELKKNKKAIVYMPTHRFCGKVKLNVHEIMDLERINELCVKYNCVFIIKKHFYHGTEREDFEQYSNIVDLTGENIDAQHMLHYADILISDYSSAYIDYLLLDRPLVLYTYDLEDYLKNERGLFIPFDLLDIGYQPQTKEKLNGCLEMLLSTDKDPNREKRLRAQQIFFDESLKLGDARGEITDVIQQLVKGIYKPDWTEVAKREMEKAWVVEILHHLQSIDQK